MKLPDTEPLIRVKAKNVEIKRRLVLQIEFNQFPLFYQLSKKRRAVYRDVRKVKVIDGKRRIVTEKVLANPKTVGKGSYTKISNQKIDNGKWGSEVKQKVVEFAKKYIKDGLSKYAASTRNHLSAYTNLIIETHLYLPENYGGVKMINDCINESTKYVKWDVSNLGTFWDKRFIDVITRGTAKPRKGQKVTQSNGGGLLIIPDDHIKIVKGAGGSIWYPCKTLSERKLIFNFYVEI